MSFVRLTTAQKRQHTHNYLSQTLIDSLHSMENEVLDTLAALETQDEDRRHCLATAKDLFVKLHATIGRDLLTMTPQDMTFQQRKWVQDRLAYYNYQLRIFYQGVLGQVLDPGDAKADAALNKFENSCSLHSARVKCLFDACAGKRQLQQGGLSEQKQSLALNIQEPERARFDWTWHSNYDWTFMDDFWYWQGFADGLGDNRPDLIPALLTNGYGPGYWMGEGVHGMASLIQMAAPHVAHGAEWLGRGAIHGLSEAGHLGVEALKAGGHLAGKALSESKDVMVSLAHHGADAAVAVAHGASSALHHAEDCCSSCGNANCDCACNCGDMGCHKCCEAGEGCVQAIAGVCGLVGTAIGSAYHKIFGGGPQPTPTPTPTPPHTTSGAMQLMSDFTDDQFEISGPVATPVKWAGMVTYGVVLGPNNLIKAGTSISNMYNGYKPNESAAKLFAQGAVGVGSYYGLKYLPLLGGPHIGFMGALFFGWCAWKAVKWYCDSSNLETFGNTNPDKYLLTSNALSALEDRLVRERKSFNPLHLQKAIKWLELEIKKEKQIALANQDCHRWLGFKLWGTSYVETERQKNLKGILSALQKSDWAKLDTYLGRANLTLDGLLTFETTVPSAQQNVVIDASAPLSEEMDLEAQHTNPDDDEPGRRLSPSSMRT
jgi:hypothetical protein